MTFYVRLGDVPRKRHTYLRDESGHRMSEELMGEQGFSGASSLLYHRHSPSAVTAVECVELDRPVFTPNNPVAPIHLRAHESAVGGDLVTGRRALLATETVSIAYVVADSSSGLYRDAVGDELVFIEQGRARLESVFGSIDARQGDYVTIPASTTHRWVVEAAEAPVRALVLELRGHITFPPRYLSTQGQLLEGAPFSERDIRVPVDLLEVDEEDVPVLVRTRNGWTRHVHLHHPFDVVGWDGYVFPSALSIHDFEPIVGRIHQPPPVHQTFAGPGFVVCSFVPRPFDFDPEAVKVPYHHANVDSDEVLFYVSGDFMSRAGSGIGAGSLSVHPAGFVHGPQPGSVEASATAERTEELAVMIDTFSPLSLSDYARTIADPEYFRSWARPNPQLR